MSAGLNSGDMWAFEQLCIKANSEQLRAMKAAINAHEKERGDKMFQMLVGKVSA